MAESAIITLFEPVAYLIASLKVLIGGVFGIYLLVLYVRWREYKLMRRMYREVRKDLIMLGEAQGVQLPPFKDSALMLLHERIAVWWRSKRSKAGSAAKVSDTKGSAAKKTKGR